MIYNIRGDKILVTEAIKEYIGEKLSKFNKYFSNPEDITANVVVKVKGFELPIAVTIPTPTFTIRNEESADDLYAAIDLVSDKIERQIRKNKTKINKIEKDAAKKLNLSFVEDYEDEEEKIIVKRKILTTKPMDEEEAILQMEMLGHDFFVYKDRDTGKVCILYKRKDNNYGLIETE